VYVSDDYAGSIYRVQWKGAAAASRSASAVAAEARGASAPVATASPGALSRGQALWKRYACAACHDPKAATPGMVTKKLEGLAKRYDAPALAAYLRTPQPPMPAFDLSDAERADLALFLLSQHP
jgi:mono/diheme cytochrome c family protein